MWRRLLNPPFTRAPWGTQRWQEQLRIADTRHSQQRGCTSADDDNDDEAASQAAEVSPAEFRAAVWPDGTPKAFRGREAWKNYIDFDSPHKSQSDELNRMRHYFFHVDSRGRLFRQELQQRVGHEGQIREPRTLDFFFGHMQRNRTGLHEAQYPYVSFRAHEHYFTSCEETPIVFNDLRDGELRCLCPDGEVARSVSTLFEPSQLRLTGEGKLLHPVVTKAAPDVVGGPPRPERLMATLDSSTAQRLLERCEERNLESGDGSLAAAIVIQWQDSETVLRLWDSGDE